MNDWNRIAPNDTVRLRAKRSAERREIQVAEILTLVRPDGRGFLGSDGEIYRFFYWDVAIVASSSSA